MDIIPNIKKHSKGNGKVSDDTEEGLLVLDWNEWSTKEVPPREFLMEPIIRQKGLVELYSGRGMGKTFLALSIAVAVATGNNIFHWIVPKPHRVLYVDGEMAFNDLQDRARAIVAAQPNPPPDRSYLQLLSADLQEFGIPSLSNKDNPAGRETVNLALKLGTSEQMDLLILDNLSALTSGGENSVHHAGKSGKQRGTSKREDLLDTVINLRQPNGYKQEEGARFEVHYEKHRGFFGDDCAPFELRYRGGGKWLLRPLSADVNKKDVLALIKGGMSYRKIEEELGISRSKGPRGAPTTAIKDLRLGCRVSPSFATL